MSERVTQAYQQLREAKLLEAQARRVIESAKEANAPITPAYLARLCGLTYDQVMRDIRADDLKARPIRRGERIRYRIARVDAISWLHSIELHDIADRLAELAQHKVDSAA